MTDASGNLDDSAPSAAPSPAAGDRSDTVSLEEAFLACQFSPAVSYPGSGGAVGGEVGRGLSSPKTAIRAVENKVTGTTQWSTMAFFIDSSGRSSFSLPLQITFSSQKHLDEFLLSGSIEPRPSNDPHEHTQNGDEGDANGEGQGNGKLLNTLLGFEVQNLQRNEDSNNADDSNKKKKLEKIPPVEVTVEAITIKSSRVDGLVLSFDTIVTVQLVLPSSKKQTRNHKENHNHNLPVSNLSGTTAQFLITPVLELPPLSPPSSLSSSSRFKQDTNGKQSQPLPDAVALELAALPDSIIRQGLSGGGGPSLLSSASISPAFADRSRTVRLLPSVPLDVTLTNAFEVNIRTIPSSTQPITHNSMDHGVNGSYKQIGLDGTTMISLSIRHSNSHNYPVQITNIALHPGHSRTTSQQDTTTKSNKNPTSPKQSQDETSIITNMTHSAQIRSADRTELNLPLTLHPWEEYSTVLCVTASEEMQSRFFVCPLSVTGTVLFDKPQSDGSGSGEGGNTKNTDVSNDIVECSRVVVSSEALWSTMRVAVEPEDAFRVELTTPDFVVERGKPIVVSARIFNLDIESRTIMLLVAKERQTSTPKESSNETSANTAVVSEADGYTFGVWGITEGDDGTAKLHRDSDLLSIDSAVVLGDVQGQHAVDVELRFVPLRLGLLKIPDLKIYDQPAKRWYTCMHSLSIVST